MPEVQKVQIKELKNLIDIQNLGTGDILDITNRAKGFKQGFLTRSYNSKHVAMAFFENSTRTKFSFEMALNKLGASIYNFETSKSSLSKGEDFFDTVNNLAAIGINAIIIRHNQEGIVQGLVDNIKHSPNLYAPISIINAGEGKRAHPTQALLDFYTMQEALGTITGKNIVIIGDILHSRVAKSNIELLSKFGANITCCAPACFKDETLKNVTWSEDLNKSLENADIAMCLRIQKERIQDRIDFEDYIAKFQVNSNNLSEKTLLMHPGPVNRDIEISSELLDSKKGKTILQQANNGVYVRMAILDWILEDANG